MANKLVLVAIRRDHGVAWARRFGLSPQDVIIVTTPGQLQGLEGVRKNPEHGLFALYVDDWNKYRAAGWEAVDMMNMLVEQGFNGPIPGGGRTAHHD